jgi:hypothetical protein
MERLTDSDIEARLPALGPAWHREGDTIVAELERENALRGRHHRK